MNTDSSKLLTETDASETGVSDAAATQPTSRRAFLSLTLAGCAACCAAVAGCGSSESGASGAAAGASPLVAATKSGDGWLVPGAGKLTPGSMTQFMAQGEVVFVTAQASGLQAISARCTHSGCTVEWKSSEKKFICPCHASAFDASGKVLKGPAQKPLAKYRVVKQGDDALVTLAA